MKIKPIPMSHVVVERPTAEVRKRKPVLCQLDTQKKLPLVESSDVKKLRQLDGTPLGYILSEDGPTVDTPFGKVPVGSLLSYQTRNFKNIEASVGTGCGNTLFPKTASVKLTDEYLCLNKDFALVDAEKLESQTQGQASCQLWKTSRAKRITASNFGKILQLKSVPSSKFLENIFNSKEISAAHLEYGRRNEPKAKAKYLELYHTRHIHECGLVVNKEFLFLGASPDGKVCDNNDCGLIEVKCPYTARDHTINQAVDELKKFILKREGNSIVFPQNHQYYDQVQADGNWLKVL
ncbi:uncharacterized protein LOC121372325 [Gigantopelta aegis]|uniref:uncharacterized protein LOC121372325 n=1 Tax=Gigantopelta aegis TaxID=1735272 RepID=UPI001B88CBB1|nr:uncharacterized protein LOC121372325 [Gigantopelta aegis]